ncbi:NAD(P)/FAD-dependent oxidoreductase [uncultured Phenylobacterium sp.]|uniref:flavin-containing monooxygenase n=1 Tax=uncultured Phenylobacterium sp. TaxID=349273 RepID=UPI0025EC5734|nr:NAD(P)/FAD-dependent oxidoreductase [uncultured Phenylobacterium sp.]
MADDAKTVEGPVRAAQPPAADPQSQEHYDAIKAKFAAERDLRLAYRPEGSAQYTSELTGDLARYAVDPYSAKAPPREPLNDHVEALFIGGGFSALLTAARLRERGVESIRIVERGGDVGGTWYWNRYPGAACDVPAADYLPLLDEMGYVPPRFYAPGPEIFAHCQAIARRYDLYDLAVFHTTVTSTTWDEDAKVWRLTTDRGDNLTAQFVICANGTLSKPKLSKIRGMETFAGYGFHSSCWDYEYTGEQLEKLSDKVVGIIGTGASAVQIIPRVGKAAKALYVFQRTPSGIDIRNDRPTDPEWIANLKPGWQQARREKNLRGGPPPTPEQQAQRAALSREERIRQQENANIDHMMRIHRRIEEIVEDPKTAEALKPWYMFMCKRPCFDDEYLPAFNRPNVHLVDTHGKGITEIAPEGPVFEGVTYPVDVLIYATGFEVQKTGIYNRIVGQNGVDLNQLYDEQGIRTLFGVHTHGFPNLFIMGGYQASFQFNLTFMLQCQGDHIAECIKLVRAKGCEALDVKPETEEWWVQEVISHRGKTNRNAECTPGYYNFEGEFNRRQDGNYNGGFLKYYTHMNDVRQSLEDHFEFS